MAKEDLVIAAMQLGDRLSDKIIETSRNNISAVDSSIAEIKDRAFDVADRTKDTAFQVFGEERVDVANEVAGDPDYSLVDGIVDGAAATVGGLLLLKGAVVGITGLAIYGAYKLFKPDDSDSKKA